MNPDDINLDNILFPKAKAISEAPLVSEEAVPLDAMEAPERVYVPIDAKDSDIEADSYAVEYDDLSDDSDDFHGEVE